MTTSRISSLTLFKFGKSDKMYFLFLIDSPIIAKNDSKKWAFIQ
ncbi:protein of unknown function [Streptococcus thermophilus]|nr:protein of unknown function [Streptococcus thermophilus]